MWSPYAGSCHDMRCQLHKTLQELHHVSRCPECYVVVFPYSYLYKNFSFIVSWHTSGRMQLARILLLCSLFDNSSGLWFWSRRRRRGCSAINCAVNNWSSWSNCGADCGTRGYQNRYRSLYRAASCGGSCNTNNNVESRLCNGPCCQVK